jgi:hypothetical protein
MTIKDLKETIKDLPDDMLIGGSGHYGELLDCYGTSVTNVWKRLGKTEQETIFCVAIENPGPEPD